MSSKKQFEVQENESIEACLNRMKDEGYTPIRRIEKPIFKEVKLGSSVTYEPMGRYIVFEAKKLE
ncbi:NETI motif-containing protein [Bacillus sp. T3]|uniref:NETI motif-containing protein n=1 Tax=Bacillus sp. T3 TaxID=467262 RepID=UPI002982838D|nr:NETI motif-containing protein [Bacillus sp. T3]